MVDYFVLYIANECVLCNTVVDYLERKSIQCLVINVDNEGDSPPIDVFNFPVLFNRSEIVAYGLDIVEYFQLNERRP